VYNEVFILEVGIVCYRLLVVIDDIVILLGGVVALGKFDALHIGHRELAIQASRAGPPFLLSFVGMAKVFGWEHRYCTLYACIKPIQRFIILFFYMAGKGVWFLH
jgi:hypothetical protein